MTIDYITDCMVVCITGIHLMRLTTDYSLP